MADLAQVIQKERERLRGLREEALTRRAKIDDEIADIDRQLKAADAYDAALKGPTTRKLTGSRRGSRQDGILALLQGKPGGLTRGEILDDLGLKGDKTAEQSISNALNNMKKANKLTQLEGGKYALAS